MQRVMIIGGSGSGKSTVARRLGNITSLPVIHIDKLFWLPEWVERPKAERDRLMREAIAAERWIFDGNYSSTFDERAARADTIVFLDIATARRIARVVWRTAIHFGRSRPDMTEGCPERLNADYLDFVVNWVAGYNRRGARAKALALLEGSPRQATVHHLTSPRDVERFLAGVATSQQKTAPEGAA